MVANASITLTSKMFAAGKPIPRPYTADGRNVSPPLSWKGVPAETKELALLVDDPDAPRAEPWVHWILFKIPPHQQQLSEDIPPAERVAMPPGCLQGKNSWGRTGYGGPEPPRGHGVHHYHFKLYALDVTLELPPRADKKELLAAMQGHVIAQGELVGTYERT